MKEVFLEIKIFISCASNYRFVKSLDNSLANALGITAPEPSTSKVPVENLSLKRPFNTENIESATQSNLNKGSSPEGSGNRKSIGGRDEVQTTRSK